MQFSVKPVSADTFSPFFTEELTWMLIYPLETPTAIELSLTISDLNPDSVQLPTMPLET